MCNRVDPWAVVHGRGIYDKRGDGQAQEFPILVTLCQCGETYWARVKNGIVWVEAERKVA